MKAIVIHEPGGPEVLQYQEWPDPVAGPGEVLVRVAAAGINFSDTGARQNASPAELPRVAGTEASGTVIALGEGVAAFSSGDLVAFQPVPGSYAEKVAVPAERAVKLPPGMDPKDAAACMLQGRTAYALVKYAYPVKAGDRVLVHAAAGGVGLLLTQLARQAGAYVFATVGSDAKVAAAREAGADHVINYSQQAFDRAILDVTGGRGVNAIFDSVGRATFLQDIECLGLRGVIVLYGRSSGPIEPFDPSLLGRVGGYVTSTHARIFAPTQAEWRAQVEEVFGLVASGRLKVRRTEYPLARAAGAHRDLQERRSIGKLILIP